MQNDRCAAGGAAGCENRSAGAAGLHFRRFRRALLPLAAAAALLFPGGPAARAECTAEGKTVTCTGDLSGGEDVRAGQGTYTTINIHGLTRNITPGSGKDGLKFSGTPTDVLEIVIDAGGFDITTRGGGEGIYANMQGNLDITVLADKITTNGDFAYGILLETQQNGDVKATVTGDITTWGSGSDGIRVTAPGTITIEMAGDITTKGSDSRGLYAKPANGNIRITLRGGTIVSEQYAGIEFDDGVTNSLTIGRGATVRISGGTSDILGGAGNETIDNFGILTALGNIHLGGGSNAFNNHAGATFNSGAVDLGSGNILSNAGDLSPGGADAVLRTALTDDFRNFISDDQGVREYGTFTVTIGPNLTADLLQVEGVAFLGGTVRVVGLHEGTYTILVAGSISDTEDEFDEIVGSLFYDRSLGYSDSNSDNTNDTVTLSSTRNSATFRSFAATANQRAVAGALDSLPADNAMVTNLMAATEREEVRAAYDGLSGEVHASLKGTLMDAGRATAAAVNRRLARFGAPGARDGFWIEGHGGRSETDAASGAARMTADRRGAVFGVDRALDGGWRLGALGGYGRTELRQRARRSSGSVDSRSVGLYGGLESGALRFGAGALYTGHAVDVRRSVRIGDVSQRLSAGYDARSWQVFAEAGHRIQAGGLTLEPFAGVSHTGLDTEGFRESGGGAALTASSDTDAMTFATLGLRTSMPLDDGVRLRGMAGWRHASGDTAPSSAHSMAGGARFAVAGAPVAQDALDIELGIEASLADTATFGAAYTGRYGGGAGHGVTAELRVAF